MPHDAKRETLAEILIRAIGGEGRGAKTRTAKALGIPLSAVSKWSAPRSKKGTAGDIPNWLKPQVLDLIEEKNLPVPPEVLIRGYRKVSA